MAEQKKSKHLLVTDYAGNLHPAPMGNKNYYLGRNIAVKDKQYKIKEMDSEEEVMKFIKDNDGVDPDFVAPAKANEVIAAKDNKINDQQQTIENLKALLLKAGITDTDATGIQSSNQTTKPEKAEDVIAKIVAAASPDEVKKLSEGDARKTVQDAATKKLAEFN